MTAVGGFVFNPSGNGIAGVTVRLFSAPPSGDRCATGLAYGASNFVADYVTGADGFYFFWQKNRDNSIAPVSTANDLASGFKYYVALCDFTGAPGSGSAMPFAKMYWPARSMSSTLGNKEFDEQDFFVSGPTRLTYTAQPISAKLSKNLGTVTVALLDGFGNIMTLDLGGGASTIAMSIGSGPAGILSSSVQPITHQTADEWHCVVVRPSDLKPDRCLQAERPQFGARGSSTRRVSRST